MPMRLRLSTLSDSLILVSKCIVDDKISSNFLWSDSRSTYVRKIRAMRLVLRYKTLLLLLKDLIVERATSEILGVTLANDTTLSHAREEDAIFTIRVVDFFSKEAKRAFIFPFLFHVQASTPVLKEAATFFNTARRQLVSNIFCISADANLNSPHTKHTSPNAGL